MTVEPRLPGRMGVWSDGGDVVWLPCALYENRHAARTFAMNEWGCDFLDVHITTTWLRFEPYAWEERWVECEGTEPGAFKTWRLEAA